MSDELVCRVAAVPLPCAPASVLIEGQRLDRFEFDLWRRCDRLRSLQDHALHIARALDLDGGDIAQLQAALSDLAERGLLAPFRLPPVPDTTGPSRIEVVAILSCDRPAGLARAFETLLGPACEGRTLLIADDSEAAPDTSPLPGIQLRRVDRQRWADGISDPALRQAAEILVVGDRSLGITTGANVNAVRLACVDRNVLIVDDDVHGPVVRAPHWDDGALAIVSDADATELNVYANREAVRADAVPTADCVADLHERVLGRSGAALCAGAGHLNTSRATPEALAAMCGTERVHLSAMGYAGDSGMRSPFYYLTLEGESGARLDRDYQRLRLSRELIRAAPDLTLGYGHGFQAGCFALAQDVLLAPSLPVGRSQDVALAAALRFMYPDSPIAFLPRCVQHDPPPGRAYDEDTLFDPVRPSGIERLPFHALTSCVATTSERTPQMRLDALGRHFHNLGNLPASAFDDWASETISAALAARLRGLEALLQRIDGPRADDLERALEIAEDTLCRPRAGLRYEDSDRGRIQRHLSGVGDAYQAWPELLAHAREHPLVPVVESATVYNGGVK